MLKIERVDICEDVFITNVCKLFAHPVCTTILIYLDDLATHSFHDLSESPLHTLLHYPLPPPPSTLPVTGWLGPRTAGKRVETTPLITRLIYPPLRRLLQ